MHTLLCSHARTCEAGANEKAVETFFGKRSIPCVRRCSVEHVNKETFRKNSRSVFLSVS